MARELKEKFNALIVNKYIPDVFGESGFMAEDDINIVAIELQRGSEKIKIIKPRNSIYSNLFVGDTVTVYKYLYIEPYKEYIKRVKEYIYTHNSENINKEAIFKKYNITEEEFNKKPIGMIDYEIKSN